MTTDISQLCRLIATPAEPLALRLSSNLLVGAARWVPIVNNFTFATAGVLISILVYTEVWCPEEQEVELMIGQ